MESIKTLNANLMDVAVLQKRFSLLTRLRRNTFFTISRLADAMSASFQYKNFCTFRSLLFTDAVIKLDMSRGLMDMIYCALNPENNIFQNLNDEMKDLLTHTLNLNAENLKTAGLNMEKAQFLSVVDEKFLIEIHTIMHSLGYSYNSTDNQSASMTRPPTMPHGVSVLNDYFEDP